MSTQGMAEMRLRDSDNLELRQTHAAFHHGVLTLSGSVSTFHVRQIAQELIKDLPGIEIIDNQIVTKEEMPVEK